MNREILFRAKRVDNGEWIEGSRITLKLHRFIVNDTVSDLSDGYIQSSTEKESSGIFHKIKGVVEVIPETVGQYTSLTDKYVKKIFEGDIVMHIQKYDISGVVASVGIVRWSNSYGAWVITDFDNGRADMFLGNEAHRTEVIGNIHDNPELLEG